MSDAPMWEEPIPVSALEHWSYCKRQCALIHLEQTFDDNLYTRRGERAHLRTHAEGRDSRREVRSLRGVRLWSLELGLTGKADVVEFHDGRAYPVEYKVGRRHRWGHEDIQLAAQAICLEEMLQTHVPAGAIFYSASQRRREVPIGAELRALVVEGAGAIRAMLQNRQLPPPVNDARCPRCSLYDTCLPGVVGGERRMRLLRSKMYQPLGE